MSYIAATAPASGPPGPLRVPGTQLGSSAYPDPCVLCRKVGVGDVLGFDNQTVVIGALALGVLYFLTKKKR